jgi:hypothetical protein
MTGVVVSAFRRALAGLVLCFGLFGLLLTWMGQTWPRAVPGIEGWRLDWSGVYQHSPWDIPIATGVLAACVLAAAAIYPARSPQWRLLPHGENRRVEDDVRVLHR